MDEIFKEEDEIKKMKIEISKSITDDLIYNYDMENESLIVHIRTKPKQIQRNKIN